MNEEDAGMESHTRLGDDGGRKYGPEFNENNPNPRRYAAPRRRDENGKLTSRRYGPSTQDPQDELEHELGTSVQGYKDLTAMDETSLRQMALQVSGRRFNEGETVEHMRDEIRRETTLSGRARYA